jgi:periplasmic mercuric ion binding protein
VKSVIVLLAIFFLYSTTVSAQDTTSVKIKTSAMCGSCKNRIEKKLKNETGVVSAVLDVDTKIATVVYKPSLTTPDKIRKAISSVGYDADNVAADPEAYKKLPACCQKGGM